MIVLLGTSCATGGQLLDTFFRNRLKIHFSAVPFPTSSSACEVTCAIFRHFNHLCYFLTYLLVGKIPRLFTLKKFCELKAAKVLAYRPISSSTQYCMSVRSTTSDLSRPQRAKRRSRCEATTTNLLISHLHTLQQIYPHTGLVRLKT